MKICVVQTRPVKGDIQTNITNHTKLIGLAISSGADMIIFPELSITGYEPEMARELAMDINDNRFNDFQQISDANQVKIGVGAPTMDEAGLHISMIVFQPKLLAIIYSKKYLHADEEPFFTSGQNFGCLPAAKPGIGLAICYELSIPEHSANAFECGAEIYVASVAKTAEGIEKAHKSLSEIAAKYAMLTLVSNCVGHCDNFESAGRTAIWNKEGLLIAELDDRTEGLLIVDTTNEKITNIPFRERTA